MARTDMIHGKWPEALRRRLTAWLRRMRGRDGCSATHDLRQHSPQDLAIIERARQFSITSDARLQALLDAVVYCERRRIPGAFAECGVWRGGSVLAMLLKLQELGATEREIYLFDTFDGMTAPDDRDTSPYEPPARQTWEAATREGRLPWQGLLRPELFSERQVRELMAGTGYPEARLHFVKGPVEQTLPRQAPPQLALLRLDTDWYESTRHELEHLYPRLAQGGVLIVDDYGHWEGCRQAVDEYFASGIAAPVLLSRIDYTGRMAIKH